jgi:neutral ceramidase
MISGLTVLATSCRVESTVSDSHVSQPRYLVGRSKADITGPIGLQMFGYVRADQISAGIHTRQWARTFVIAQLDGEERVALVTVDLGSVTHEMLLEVVERLETRFGDVYDIANVVIAATHTHAGPGGYWHYGSDSTLGVPFCREHFDAIADGIVRSIVAAHEDLAPGSILIRRGPVAVAGVNRSGIAYLNNPATERALFESDTDREMTLLKLVRDEEPIGTLNWFAVHPSSMSSSNKLISGDNKGYAAWAFERRWSSRGFVAAFAQSNDGDVTPNLNLDTTGPGTDEFDSTRIIGQRQLDAALELFHDASEELHGPIRSRQIYVDFSRFSVRAEFTGDGSRSTCPSALGYSFFAGSTEDSGERPLFHEGMTEREPALDRIAQQFPGVPVPSDALRACQSPKAVLVATGEMIPPAQPQILSLALVRIGPLTLVVGPAEFTTMAGRRLRRTVGARLDIDSRYVVVAGYANGYAGYVTTPEEYQAQQYEGGHTLFGPWTLPAYQQSYDRLAESLLDGTPILSAVARPELRGKVRSTALGLSHDDPPPGGDYTRLARQPNARYRRGERVEATFWSGSPQHAYHADRRWVTVLRRETSAGKWTVVATDADWSTRCRWSQPGVTRLLKMLGKGSARPFQLTATWDIPDDAKPGRYVIVYYGVFRPKGASDVATFDARSREFELISND